MTIPDGTYGGSRGIAFTPNGDAWLAYPTGTSRIGLKRWSGGNTFTALTVPTTNVYAFSLGLTAAGQPALAVVRYVSNSFSIEYTQYNGTSWDTTPLFDGTATGAATYEVRLTFSPAGDPVVVAFTQTNNASTLRAWLRSGTTWTAEDVSDAAPGSRDVSATWLGSVLHLSWARPTTMYTDQHARRTSGTWSSTPLAVGNGYGNTVTTNGSNLDFFTVTSIGGSGIWVRVWNTVWNGTSYGAAAVVDEVTNSTATGGGNVMMSVGSSGTTTHLAYPRQAPVRDLRHAWRTGTTGAFATETIETGAINAPRLGVGPAGDSAVIYGFNDGTNDSVHFAYER